MDGPTPDPPRETPAEPDAYESPGQPERAGEGEPASGFPEPQAPLPGDRSDDPTPHRALNAPVAEPDPTEWPDPYESRPDPRDPPDPDGEPFGDEPHTASGATSTSAPHPSADPEAEPWEGPKRDRLDE